MKNYGKKITDIFIALIVLMLIFQTTANTGRIGQMNARISKIENQIAQLKDQQEKAILIPEEKAAIFQKLKALQEELNSWKLPVQGYLESWQAQWKKEYKK